MRVYCIRLVCSEWSCVDMSKACYWLNIYHDLYEQVRQTHTHTHTVKGSQFLLIYNRLKENLFKENPAVKFQKGSGAVFGHQLLHGKWVYHNLTSIQSSRLRDLINEEAVERLDSL